MSPFSAPFSGAPKSEGGCFQSERLLYGREPNGVRAEPGKQKPRSCRTQELGRSRAQENERQKKEQPVEPITRSGGWLEHGTAWQREYVRNDVSSLAQRRLNGTAKS
jgi:hypothetical protein